ncbi:MAG: MerR family DNA-binding transcriptional regulator [Planctomycetota bacterium]|nr:MAG: MerR family DNA-binding transcriptional regulator [Planctomycetota bacterium]
MKHFLSPRELSALLGVSESSIKRWTDDGLISSSRTAGGHRRIAVTDALQFVRSQGLEMAQTELLGLPALRGEHRHLEAAIKESLLSGDRPTLERLLVDQYASGASIAALCDGPLRQSFQDIGDLWQHQDDGIFIEHRAVDCCLQALTTLRGVLPSPPSEAPQAVGGAPSNDPYLLPSIIASLVLLAEGWRTVNLGPNTPWQTLITAAQHLHPTLIWVTVSAPVAADIAAGWKDCHTALSSHGVRCAVGGRHAEDILGHHHENCLRPQTMVELVAQAQKIRDQSLERVESQA